MPRTTPLALAALSALALAGCGDEPTRFTPEDAGGGFDVAQSDAAPDFDNGFGGDRGTIAVRDNGPVVDDTLVYAHSEDTLWSVDPRTNSPRRIGDFTFPSGDRHMHGMTDLAVDATGAVVGVSRDALWRINTANARCTLVIGLPDGQGFVGLTYLPVGVLDPSAEVLVGGTSDGAYWRINASTGRAQRLGMFNGGYGLSGDIVSIANDRTYATVRRSSETNDSLAELNPATGALRVIGTTGFTRIFGLGYWRQTLYGFTNTGQFITIDARTGRGRQIAMPTSQFWGAGVTTTASTEAPP